MRRSVAVPYLFLAPYLAVFVVLRIWPAIQSILLSFQNTRVNPFRFQPLVNWGRLVNDITFIAALKNTFLILLVQVPLMLALATFLALALNSPLLKARGIFRFAFFAPVVVGEVAYSAIFRLMFNGKFGAVNGALAVDRDDGHHSRCHLALDGLQRHHHSRRPAEHPARPLRGRRRRRRAGAEGRRAQPRRRESLHARRPKTAGKKRRIWLTISSFGGGTAATAI